MNTSEERNLIKAATLYYKEGLTQAQIAKRFGVSRSLISKWLIAARKQGYIEIFFNSEEVYAVDLELKLEQLFGLKSAVVINTTSLSSNEIAKTSGQTAALAIKDLLAHAQHIGVSWGNSIKNLVTQFPFENYPDKVFIPLVGGMGTSHFEIHANQLCYEFAHKTHSSAEYLYAPAFVENDALRQSLAANTIVNPVLAAAKNVDLALVSVSSPFHPNTMSEIGYLSEQEIADLHRLGVVGDMNSRFFDKDGHEVDHELNHNVLGVSIEELKKIPNVVAIAYEETKWPGIYHACQNKLITNLITTDTIAKHVVTAASK